MQQRLIELTKAFAHQNPVLFSSYLLHTDGQQEFAADSPESYYAFLLWFIVYGRTEYRAPAVIEDELRTVLTPLDERGCHPLMHYLAQRSGLAFTGEALRTWYYAKGVAAGQIGGALSRRELAALGQTGALSLKTILEGPPGGREPDAAGAASSAAFLRTLDRLARAAAPDEPLPSVTIVGLHRSVLGIGEDARCLFDCLCEAGIVAELLDVSPSNIEPHDGAGGYAAFETTVATGSVVIFCLPAFEMMRSIGALNLTRMKERQIWIGYWPWETTALPRSWKHVYDFVDEVWASSRFLLDVYAKETAKPVIHMPLHVSVAEPVVPEDVRSVFESRFSFLSIFDFNSRIERKNPLGSIAAFRKAFPTSVGDVQMVLKTLHGEHRPRDFDRIVAAAEGDRRIVIIDGVFPKVEVCGLITLADVYLSLHRSEGFGRPIAEAMLLETPVIATSWSGSADFVSERTGFPVRFTLRPVKPGEYAFAVGEWAEPDIDHAAALMRQVHARPDLARGRLVGARYAVEHSFGRKPVAARLKERLKALVAGLSKPTPFRNRR